MRRRTASGPARAGRLCLLAALSGLAALVLAEILLRLFLPQPLLHDPDAFAEDAVLGARLRPGFTDRVVTTEFASTWVINQDGYRGPRAGERAGFTRRVVALGDSFTFGYGVEEAEAWPRVLETRLNEGRPPEDRVEVLNLGVGGYGTWEEALWLEEIAPKIHPDLVVVALYVGNDPLDNLRAAARAKAGARPGAGTASGRSLAPRSEAVKRWLGSRSHLYALVAGRSDELLVRLGLRRLVYPFEMEVLRGGAGEPAEIAAAWSETRPALALLASVGRAAGAPVVVAIIPMKHQVSDVFWDRLRAHYEGLASGSAYDRERPQRILRPMIEASGLRAIDLLEGLRRAARGPEGASDGVSDGARFYWPRDQHFTARGHAEAARLIAEEVAPLLAWRAGTPPNDHPR